MKLKWIDVVFVIEFIASIYMILLYDLLERILSGGVELIIGILGALIGGALLYYWMINKKKIEEHSQDIVNTVLKEWLKDTRLLKQSAKRQQAVEHIRKGYPNVCNLLIEHENLRNIYSESYSSTREYIKNKLIEKVPSQFIDQDSVDQPSTTYFKLFTAIDSIHKEAKYFLDNKQIILSGIKTIRSNKHIFYSVWQLIAQSDKKELIDDFKKVWEEIIIDEKLIELTKLCEVRKKEFDTNTNALNRELNIIIDNVIDGHQPLKNTCYRCEGWHKMFK